jgi:hypothetical protein
MGNTCYRICLGPVPLSTETVGIRGCNNSYQASLKMAPFKALYGRKCRTLLYWSETGESQLFGLEIIKEAERQVQLVRENLEVV